MHAHYFHGEHVPKSCLETVVPFDSVEKEHLDRLRQDTENTPSLDGSATIERQALQAHHADLMKQKNAQLALIEAEAKEKERSLIAEHEALLVSLETEYRARKQRLVEECERERLTVTEIYNRQLVDLERRLHANKS